MVSIISVSPVDVYDDFVESIMGIIVHEHLIVSMFDDAYYSFADQGIIKRISDEIG